jgi:DMSO/TMAO reductase YedYZ molybdopterin-dependent catalytic subunit
MPLRVDRKISTGLPGAGSGASMTQMRARNLLALCALLSVACAAALGASQAPAAPDVLTIGGDVERSISFTLAELRSLPRTTVTVEDEGRTVRYEGVLIGELLERAGAPLGAELRGDAVTTYVVASARDDYQAVFSLAELDPDYTNSRIIVADTVDGQALFDYQGPLRIVAPGDTRGSRSVRMLVRLEVVRLRK